MKQISGVKALILLIKVYYYRAAIKKKRLNEPNTNPVNITQSYIVLNGMNSLAIMNTSGI